MLSDRLRRSIHSLCGGDTPHRHQNDEDMKRNLKQIIAIATAAITAVGCVSDRNGRYDPVVDMTFDPVMHVKVRSSDIGTTDTETSEEPSVGVSVWQMPESKVWGSDTATPLLENSRLVHDGEVWRTESNDQWPSVQYTLTCIGFSPFDAASGCNEQNGVMFNGIDTRENQADLRYTVPQTGLTKHINGGTIILPLQHALCEIEFMVKGKAGYESVNVRILGITIDDIVAEGDFHSLPEPAWALDDETVAIPFFEGVVPIQNTPVNVGKPKRIIPQTIESSITVDYEFMSHAGTFIHQADTSEPVKRRFEAGHYYTITLEVSPDGVEVLPEIPSKEE